MQLQKLKVSVCYESETNPRGKDFEGAAFDELVASVKEKGVLVPVLARPKAKGTKQFEIVAGNRRFRAAQEAGLAEIPAQVVEMSDDEAREAQIVENLQRADIHPLEEGEAYRKLIEDGGRTVKDVALRVGKSESYVRQRLFLTNLSDKAQKLYRRGEWPDSLMVLVAKLSPKNQDALVDDIGGQNYDERDLKEYIQEHFGDALKNQPWLTNAEAAKAVGPCKECPPNRAALFGEIKAGQCTDIRCWKRKMALYIEFLAANNPDNTVLISTQYGQPNQKNVLGRSQYEVVTKKSCDYVTTGIVVEGEKVGSTLRVCFHKDCKEHRSHDREYEQSAGEKEKAKKQREKAKAARAKFEAEILKGLENVKWPLSEKHLDALLDFTLRHYGTSYQMPIVKRHGLEPVRKKTKYGVERDYAAPLRKLAEEGGKEAKLQLVFEFLLPGWNPYGSNPNKEVKSL